MFALLSLAGVRVVFASAGLLTLALAAVGALAFRRRGGRVPVPEAVRTG